MEMESFYTSITSVWINNTNGSLELNIPGLDSPLQLDPGEASNQIQAGINVLNILPITAIPEDGMNSNLCLLFTGNVQNPSSILQQLYRTGPWIMADFKEVPQISHFIFTLETNGDGLVIVGTVELVELLAETV